MQSMKAKSPDGPSTFFSLYLFNGKELESIDLKGKTENGQHSPLFLFLSELKSPE